MATVAIPVYARAAVATTNVDFTIGTADAVMVKQNCRGVTLTLVGGATLSLGDFTDETGPQWLVIPIACTKATFTDAGFVIALKGA